MKKSIICRLVVLSVIGMMGCSNSTPPMNNNSAPPATPSPATNAATGAPATGIWNQSQVEQWLKEELKLTELTLNGSGNGNYTGQARDATGKSFHLKVMQIPGGIACEYTFGPGGSGRISFGNAITAEGQPAK